MIDNLTGAIRHYKQKAQTLREYAKPFAEAKVGMTTKKYIEHCLERVEYNEQLAEWLTELQERREADRWIPVSERLPDKAGEYLCTLHYAIPPYHMFHPEKDVYVDAINVQGFDGTAFVSSVIAWQPLPKPYESEDK